MRRCKEVATVLVVIMALTFALHRWLAAAEEQKPAGAAGASIPRLDLTANGNTPTHGGLSAAARRGYDLLLNKPFLPPDFDQQTFDELWKTWEEPLRSQAEAASAEERRQMAFARYGLIERPGDPAGRPLQYVVSQRGEWSMNCFACHQGTVAGRVVPGVPNSLYAMQTLYDEVRTTKLRLGKKLTHMDLGGMFMPLGGTTGTTNAVMFGVVLLAHRDADLNLAGKFQPPAITNHDHDAPPWWHFHRKRMLYIDGFAPKGPRPLMQFLLVKENGPEKFRQWEHDYEDIYAYLESLRPPKYPWPIDPQLADAGERVFRRNCASCHGTYGEGGRYPEKLVPIEVVQTDRVRLDALTPEHRRRYGESWFARFKPGAPRLAIEDPGGYVAPPLDGVWATAPYFHNGSVPTLWHVLQPSQRPKVWRRLSDDGYDHERIGLSVQTFDELPGGITSNAQRRRYFDTSQPGKSAAGHTFPDKLTAEEKRAVLEYLKTL